MRTLVEQAVLCFKVLLRLRRGQGAFTVRSVLGWHMELLHIMLELVLARPRIAVGSSFSSSDGFEVESLHVIWIIYIKISGLLSGLPFGRLMSVLCLPVLRPSVPGRFRGLLEEGGALRSSNWAVRESQLLMLQEGRLGSGL